VITKHQENKIKRRK